MKKEKIMMIKLNPPFQQNIFQRLIKKYGGSLNTAKMLEMPASSIRGYKNIYFDSVPESLLKKLIQLRITSAKELNKNKLLSFDKHEQIQKILDIGREKRRQQFKRLKNRIPKLKELLKKDFLDFEKWFDRYKFLLDTPFRKLIITKKRENIIIKYYNFTKDGFKEFEIRIPQKIPLNDKFIYFFGLWCGDRAGGKRFGICNKNEQIIRFTEEFLRENNQKVEKILYISKDVKIPPIDYDKKFVLDHDINGWVLSVHSTNGILSSFFYYLHQNLIEFLDFIQNKEVFFAGLFDAEGNVSLYNRSFRWACKNKELVKAYSKFLKKIGLYDRYDGGCLISYNLKEFYNKILPFLKHSDKINKSEFLCNGNGILPKEHKEVINYIRKYPKETAKNISKDLKKRKVYSELKLLNDFGFISFKGYPYKFEITSKGLKSLGE